jgi:hypothetical protein
MWAEAGESRYQWSSIRWHFIDALNGNGSIVPKHRSIKMTRDLKLAAMNVVQTAACRSQGHLYRSTFAHASSSIIGAADLASLAGPAASIRCWFSKAACGAKWCAARVFASGCACRSDRAARAPVCRNSRSRWRASRRGQTRFQVPIVLRVRDFDDTKGATRRAAVCTGCRRAGGAKPRMEIARRGLEAAFAHELASKAMRPRHLAIRSSAAALLRGR